MSALPRIELNGCACPAAEPWDVALSIGSYGHFTAMQVRRCAVRGLDLHLRRLDDATKALFDTGLDGERVRSCIRHALGDEVAHASVRVYVFQSSATPSLLVTLKPPGGVSPTPLRLQSVPYQRAVAHIKHLGDFGQAYYRQVAARNGFDDALLTGPDGVLSEAAIANIGFCAGATVVWPDSPMLHGITMQLLERQLAAHGIPSRRATVRLVDLASFDAVFVSNARGVAPVAAVDDTRLALDTQRVQTLIDLYETVPWDQI